jgi:hypothetical protein
MTEVSQLRRTIEDLTNSVRDLNMQMLLHNSKQEPLELLVNKHEIQLNGDGKNLAGLVTSVADFKKVLSSIERALWIVVTAILAGVGVALVEVFKAGIR